MDEDAELNTASVSGFGDIGSVLGSTQASKTRTGSSFGDSLFLSLCDPEEVTKPAKSPREHPPMRGHVRTCVTHAIP